MEWHRAQPTFSDHRSRRFLHFSVKRGFDSRTQSGASDRGYR